MSDVEFCGIRKSFGGDFVLRDFNLRIEAGQYVVLLGPSGCGKTTALRLVAGLERPCQGSIKIAGRDTAGIAPSNRDVSMVFQGDSLYPHMSIRQSILYGLRGRVEQAEAAKRIEQATKIVSIEPLLDRRPGQLSGGELRRASVVKAIVRHASVRLLDEPLSAVDADAVHSIQEELLLWHRSVPGTTLHVTHDGNEAMRIADKIAVMDVGQVVQFDIPSEIYRRPINIQVAKAVGWPPMSFLRATYADGHLVLSDGQSQTLSLPDTGSGESEILVGVRPDAWRLADPLSTETRSLMMDATLSDLRLIDHRWMATFRCSGQPITAMFLRSGGLEPGRVHRIASSVDVIHLFDMANGKRLNPE